MRIRFYVNTEKPRAAAARPRLVAEAQAAGLRVVTRGAVDAIIALGGDGTILRAAHEFPGMPLLGFNMGSLGYLANVGEGEFSKAFHQLATGAFTVSVRTMLEARKGSRRALALNDVVVVREMTGHAAELELAVDARVAARYTADGLVVATPTGSTAYSLSAGGPVLMPDSASLVVTPMNPHALAVRPIVLPDAAELKVTSRRLVNDRAERIGVYTDGIAAFRLGSDESLVIAKASVTAQFIELAGHNPYEVLGRKLGWPGQTVRNGEDVLHDD